MPWFLIAILSYLILSVVFLADKYLLSNSIPNPKVYAFYNGLLGIAVIFLIPFVGFFLPSPGQLALSLFAGAVFTYASFWFYKSLRSFEASRVVPAVGGMVPLFTFGMVFVFSFGKEILSFSDIIAFLFLVVGTVFISLKKDKPDLNSFLASLATSFLFSLSFVLMKYVYLSQPFWNGFIWARIGSFLMAAGFFILYPEIKAEIFRKRTHLGGKNFVIYFGNQAAGALAFVLQNWAIFLAPLVYVSIINALQGVQYAALLILSAFLSLIAPFWAEAAGLKEEVSKKVISQKIIAILIIGAGFAILAL